MQPSCIRWKVCRYDMLIANLYNRAALSGTRRNRVDLRQFFHNTACLQGSSECEVQSKEDGEKEYREEWKRVCMCSDVYRHVYVYTYRYIYIRKYSQISTYVCIVRPVWEIRIVIGTERVGVSVGVGVGVGDGVGVGVRGWGRQKFGNDKNKSSIGTTHWILL